MRQKLSFVFKSGEVFVRRFIKRLTDGSNPTRAVVFVGLLAFVGSAAIGFLRGIPQPENHDEFSYLLAADTFAHGRLTNPTHPMWVHFETMHVIHQPSYMSKFVPAQGIVLMLGRLLGGHPIVGVWLSMAAMCAAICWMLQAWLPPRWALLGGLLAIIHPNIGIGSYWAQSYWGGAVAAAGGALLLGGVRYLIRRPRRGYSIAAGIGLTILANSRPYEGLMLSLPVGLGLLIWLLGKQRPGLGVVMRRVILPFVFIGIITVGAMGYYNYRITGSATRLPYLVHKQEYMMASLFIWQTLPPKPAFRHKIIEDFHARFELPTYVEKHSFWGFIKVNFLTLIRHFVLVGNIFAIPLIVSAAAILQWSRKNYWGRFALFVYGFFILGIMIETYALPHYWAPITALSCFFIVQGIRLWRARDRRLGQLMVFALPILAIVVSALSTYFFVSSRNDFAPAQQRARLLARMKMGQERHLILVKYGPSHSYHAEWVHNEADIDGSKVVWARVMDPKEDCKVVRYFRERKIWSLEIDNDEEPIQLKPFATQSCPQPEDTRATSQPVGSQ